MARKSMPGRRLDAYLAAKFGNYSRAFLTTLVREGQVTINGKPVKPHYELRRGDEIHIELPVFAKATLVPQDIPIDVIHEDDHVLIINKPPDIIVHPAKAHMTGTLVNALVFYCDHLPESADKVRPGIVHRLDRDTTGVMIIVKDEAARGWIGRQFEWRRVKKRYVAIVEGLVELDSDVIDLPLGRHRREHEKIAVDRRNGREAVSTYTVLDRFDLAPSGRPLGFSLVRVVPKTGRTHQIRVHMAAIGHPVICDALYGRREVLFSSDLTGEPHGESEEPLISRQALHAECITFRHPESRELVTYTAPLPADMERTLAALRKQGKP